MSRDQTFIIDTSATYLNPVLSLPGCISLGKSLKSSIPQFPRLHNGDENSNYFRVVLRIKLIYAYHSGLLYTWQVVNTICILST